MARRLTALLLASLTPLAAAAQVAAISPEIIWPPAEDDVVITEANPPRAFTLRNISLPDLEEALARAPGERSGEPPATLGLPLPGGGFAEVAVFESPVLAESFSVLVAGDGGVTAVPVPDTVRSYVFRGIDDPALSGRLTLHGARVQALMHTAQGLARIGPAQTNLGVRYLSFLNADRADGADDFGHSPGEQIDPNPPVPRIAALQAAQLVTLAAQTGTVLRTFRLAVSTTGEYTQARDTTGGVNPVPDVLASVVTEVSNVNMLLEREVSVRLVLNTLVIYTNPATDPYDPTLLPNNPPACVTRDQNVAIDAIVGAANYDVGFAFGAGPPNNIGCAWYVLCQADKYRGAALINVGNAPGNATGVLAHEMGHQLAARHTFSGSACPPIEYNAQAAYEPGSGTTLMSYLGACNEDADGDGTLDPSDEDANNNGMLDVGEDLDGDGNLDVAEDRNGNNQLDNDNVNTNAVGTAQYYHAISFDEIVANTTALVTGGVCGAELATANMPTAVDARADYTIPRNTPFRLTGSATDPDGDTLTYVWEQFDQGNPARLIDSAGLANGPIFRSVPPVVSPDAPDHTRVFPRMPDILSGTQRTGEILPTVNRTMTFRLTARDNLTGGGGVASDEMTVTVAGSPFFVTSPNGGESIGGGCQVPVTWTVGGGNVAASVDLLLSEDGGASFDPMVNATPNDGSQAATFSCNATAQARVQAAAVGNIFFDVSDADFTISPQAPAVSIDQADGGEVDQACKFTVTFEATVTDDCGVLTGDVEVDVSLVAGVATLGPVQANLAQQDGKTVKVSGSFEVSDVALDGNMDPATFEIEVSGTDGCGLETSESTQVVVVDTIPPTIDVALSPKVLWPPNHKLVDIAANVTVTDNCPNVTFALTSASSDEPDNGVADGDTVNDIQGADLNTPDTMLRLRAERAGNMDGRVYTLGYTATDASKNTAQAQDTVSVPHSR